jgi:hypothetical protein
MCGGKCPAVLDRPDAVGEEGSEFRRLEERVEYWSNTGQILVKYWSNTEASSAA